MFNKIRDFFKQVTTVDHRKNLLEILELSDNTVTRFETIPEMVFEYIRHGNVSAIGNVSIRTMMDVRVSLAHRNVGELNALIRFANDRLAHGDVDSVIGRTKKTFEKVQDVYLDEYFVTEEEYVSPLIALQELFELLVQQQLIFQQSENSLYPRILATVYNDIRQLLVVLTEHAEF